ncbi:MAG: glucoamylase [Gaiellaceae bacterium]|nr:glucoamylase [Gaiellaceae bacterium]
MERDATGRRVKFLPAAVVGNGALLATLSARGEVERLFWPSVDWGQHLGELRLGLVADGSTTWLDEDDDEAYAQAYVEDANAVRTGGPLAELVDFALPEDVLVRRVRPAADDARVLLYCRPELDESVRYGSAYVDPGTGALVFYRRDRALAIGFWGEFAAACGGQSGSIREEAERGELPRRTIDQGAVDGALLAAQTGPVDVALAFGASPAEALALLRSTLLRRPEELLERRVSDDRAGLTGETSDPALSALYKRSLLVLDLAADRESGGVIAAPEFDSVFAGCGGYGFVWGRDLAYIVLGMLAAGRSDQARAGLKWLVRTQAPEGLWLQRHWTDGRLAPSWGLHQIDETGAILFAFEAACEELGDPALERDLWPAMRRGADFLLAFRDETTGLPRPSIDLWEERQGQHAYTAAAVYGGLCAAAKMARRHAPELAPRYAEGAREVQQAIEEHLWSEEHGRYLRSRCVGVEGPGEPPTLFDSRLPYPNPAVGAVEEIDATVDVSLLGLSWPFGAVAAESPRMRATVEAIERELVEPCGGVLRYADDDYRGGNAWILTTLWLGLHKRRTGDEEGLRHATEFALSRQTALGLLAEQVTAEGEPAWVLPLTWSHAMLLLAARPELELVRNGSDAARILASL